MEIGISLYLGSGKEQNTKIVKQAHQAGITYAFTSLHIPEEEIGNYQVEVEELLLLCKEHQLSLLVDVSPKTLEKLGYQSFVELASKTSITHIRLDYGFDYQEIVDLSKLFTIVFNASTLLDADIRGLQEHGADFTKFIACHNFYPKPYTALSIDRVKQCNQKLQYLGMRTMGFVAGDNELRGPLHCGLPTVEEHRNEDVIYSILDLHYNGNTDICMIGDIDVLPKTWVKLKQLVDGYVTLPCKILKEYEFVQDSIHHDRPDSSEYIIRSQESRGYGSMGKEIAPLPARERELGSICMANTLYLRYSGELEITRKYLPADEKVNVIGKIQDSYLCYLPLIMNGMGFKLIQEGK